MAAETSGQLQGGSEGDQAWKGAEAHREKDKVKQKNS